MERLEGLGPLLQERLCRFLAAFSQVALGRGHGCFALDLGLVASLANQVLALFVNGRQLRAELLLERGGLNTSVLGIALGLGVRVSATVDGLLQGTVKQPVQ